MKSNITLSRARQETGSYCGPAVMQMLVSSLGLSMDQETLIDACKARKTVMREGIPLNDLSKGLQEMYPELDVWWKSEATIEDIQNLLDNGYFVGVDWQGIFSGDEYGDDEVNKWGDFWNKIIGAPEVKGEQGHYCVALEVNKKKGYLRFADPYGHYAGKDRFVALWEFEERWWDDRIGKDEKGKKTYVLESKLMFLVTKKGDEFPKSLGMMRV
ncbi:TPA: hypothetical protein DIU27_04610 [Candidatus Collierbacteria bacterium]|uniref:Peptidase C39-like domain-containing protein n=1 Tax=Candidatus Collierbacteria bacterium GW2011_GWB2_44_22 TaxID=1618387 RepID=A0A0G1HYU9_9BACT|nr:MAG: hypothetical protein UW31_C0011G0012 [Candidatus Collierbacteria bacterium GW2011_GWA2_44_13]KKT51748.1 MAG: hypothetical protein UW44_C0008G0070 [Candidatus Collierbacteria bacterium GW2011_GWB2_44_22]KKT61741.1 MAG: hypothetical protein UW56_C0019G0001 [Candidatus Collierbacteria bacterium GW2011_GWD1_44_27]KKT88239.1 MAG: hypothetical protein UW88_C0013G0008 [Candidatus Collierbacteria bacterium GW2011_GWD2_45_10]HCQ31632.1 hypothetical protein [Candidatus Collierbacteria bacterium]